MNRSDSPKKQPVPFGLNGQRENLLNTTPAGDNTASYDAGFPPVTMILKAAGGLPPKGQDMNQILFELSSLARWQSAGALNSYDASFATSIQGYPKGAVLLGDDGVTIFISTTDANNNNPNSSTTGWVNLLTFLGGAPISSPTFTGAPAVPDMLPGNYGSQIANSKFVRDAINVLIGSAPESLNTLGELAQAIGNDPNFSTATAQSISNLDNAKMAKSANGSDIGDKGKFLTNLGVGNAALRNVGNASGQIPDMSFFELNSSQTGWEKRPNGIIRQWGYVANISPNTIASVAFLIPFPNKILSMGMHTSSPSTGTTGHSIMEFINPTASSFGIANIALIINATVAQAVNSGVYWWAEGH